MWPASTRCIPTWLARWRTCSNPCATSTAHTSRPEKTWILPNGDLDAGHEHVAAQPEGNLVGRGGFEEQLERLGEVGASLLNGVAFAGNVQFRSEGDVAVAVCLDESRQADPFHGTGGVWNAERTGGTRAGAAPAWTPPPQRTRHRRAYGAKSARRTGVSWFVPRNWPAGPWKVTTPVGMTVPMRSVVPTPPIRSTAVDVTPPTVCETV